MDKHIYTILILLAVVLFNSCSMSKDEGNQQVTGDGGSLARFTIVGDYLYTVDETSLNTYSIVQSDQPKFRSKTYLGFGAETIFPYGNALLLGTQDGMYVCGLTNPAAPEKLNLFQHIRSCDPVVAENSYAYITLNSSNSRCWRGLDELQVVDLHNISAPYLLTSYSLTSPKGLDIHNDTLYVCDDGIRILNVANKYSPQEIAHFYDVSPEDLIYTQGRLLAIGSDGFTQYAISPNGR